jgi:CheY-like chemotaxis protein
MEPSALLIAAVTYAAAQVAQKVADEMTDSLWAAVKKAWGKAFETEPQATEVTSATLAVVAEQAPDLPDALFRLIGESPALRRLRRVQDLVEGARILWIDDHPQWNSWEIACLEAAGAHVRTVETTRSALALVGDGYDVVVSDVNREGNATEGLDALPRLTAAAPATATILYVEKLQPGVPAGAFGITNRPDELLHLVFDVLERKRS